MVDDWEPDSETSRAATKPGRLDEATIANIANDTHTVASFAGMWLGTTKPAILDSLSIIFRYAELNIIVVHYTDPLNIVCADNRLMVFL